MRLAVCGYGRSGKDTAGRMIADMTGLRLLKGSSDAAAEVVYREWGHKLYRSAATCWADRHSWRERWARTIWDYNKPDGLTLYREMVADGNDILIGIRKWEELTACVAAGLVDCSLWINRSGVDESVASMTISESDCDFTVINDGTIDDLQAKLSRVFMVATKRNSVVNG